MSGKKIRWLIRAFLFGILLGVSVYVFTSTKDETNFQLSSFILITYVFVLAANSYRYYVDYSLFHKATLIDVALNKDYKFIKKMKNRNHLFNFQLLSFLIAIIAYYLNIEKIIFDLKLTYFLCTFFFIFMLVLDSFLSELTVDVSRHLVENYDTYKI